MLERRLADEAAAEPAVGVEGCDKLATGCDGGIESMEIPEKFPEPTLGDADP